MTKNHQCKHQQGQNCMQMGMNQNMFQKFNSSKCAACLQYKCHKNDAAMPTLVGKRRKHCIEVMQAESPTSSPHTSDAKDD